MPITFANRPDFDVIVVGARCAGAATALNLAKGGARVLVIERDAPGTDTLSTHAIMRTGVMLLERWGVLPGIIAAGTPVIRRTIFQYGSETVDVAIKPQGGAEGLYAPRRQLLDGLLARAAAAAGAEIFYGATLTGLRRNHAGRVTGIELRDAAGLSRNLTCDLVVGADGRASAVADLAGAHAYVTSQHASAAIYGYFKTVPSDGYRWIFRPGLSAGVIPTNDGRSCIFASAERSRFASLLGGDPQAALSSFFADDASEIAAVIAEGPAERMRRFTGAKGFLRRSYGPGWALVGDAGYFKDPATAHGITDALRDADALARATLSGRPGAMAGYQKTRDALSRHLFQITDRIASHNWTMDELRSLHFQLHTEMQTENVHVARIEHALAA